MTTCTTHAKYRFLDSLIFNNEVDAYQSWTLFLIFVSILILISGVVLLTHKKPEPGATPKSSAVMSASVALRNRRIAAKKANASKIVVDEDEEEEVQTPAGENDVLWAVGEVSDDDEGEDEDIDHHQNPRNRASHSKTPERKQHPGDEGVGLMERHNNEEAGRS